MTCKECRNMKPFAPGSVYCLLYGIIIREDHEANLKGCEASDDHGGDERKESGDDEGYRFGTAWPVQEMV